MVKNLLKKIVKDLEESKGFNIEVINVKNRSALADYMIIVSGTSSRHINAIVNNVVKSNKKNVISTEGLKSTDWLIVDFGDVILNVFKPEMREHYALEKDLEKQRFKGRKSRIWLKYEN